MNKFISIVFVGSICLFDDLTQQFPASVPYFTDFESGNLQEWSNLTTVEPTQEFFTRFTGRNGNTQITLNLTGLEIGSTYAISFDFFAIDTWDGGSDIFIVSVNGSELFRHSFNNFGGSQSYPGIPDAFGNFGFNNYNDAIYRNITVTFSAVSNSTAVSFAGQNLEDVNNESWGLDNVSVFKVTEPAYIAASELPLDGSTNSVAIDSFYLLANKGVINRIRNELS